VDKKAKKRLAVLKKKRENLNAQLISVRRNTDDPAELQRLEQELADLETEVDKLKDGRH
jgi:cell division protein FtsB